jgi:tetratricopeptide (TPR) repeat protein
LQARTGRLGCLVLSLALVECATTRRLVERPWIEVSSANFSIYTTLGEPDARRLLEDLELFRGTVALVSNIKRQEPRVPTEIYAFRSSGDFGNFQPARNVAGFFSPGLRSNRVALTTSGPIDERAVLYHEYTHFLVRNQDHLLYPPWFDEGFAELLGTSKTEGEWIVVGSLPEHRRNSFLYLEAMPFSRLIRARDLGSWSQENIAMFYAQSWLLVHYLMYGRPEEERRFSSQMARYLALLEQRVPEEQAFDLAFDLSFAELQRRMQKYTRVPSYRFSRDAVKLDFQTAVRSVSRDEIGVRLGWLALSTGKLALAQQLFEEALAANPSNSRALAGIGDAHKFSHRFDEAEQAYRASLQLDSGNWENHLEYGEYLLDRALGEEQDREPRLAEAREHFRRAIELAPEIPEGHAVLGATYVVDPGSPDPGIEALEHAARLLPSHPAIHFPLAQLHHRAGHRERAIELLRRVVYWSHSPEEVEQARVLLDELQGPSGSPGD